MEQVEEEDIDRSVEGLEEEDEEGEDEEEAAVVFRGSASVGVVGSEEGEDEEEVAAGVCCGLAEVEDEEEEDEDEEAEPEGGAISRCLARQSE